MQHTHDDSRTGTSSSVNVLNNRGLRIKLFFLQKYLKSSSFQEGTDSYVRFE